MTRLPRRRHALSLLLLPFLAATLACNALSGSGAAGAALTQAAATVTAAANLAATAQAALPTSAPIPTQAPTALPPTAANSPTPAPSATAAPTEAATAAATDTPPAGDTPTPGAAVVLDPCTLITVPEAQSLTGVPMGAAKAQAGGCLIADAATGIGSGVILYALPAAQAGGFLSQFVPSLKQVGVTIDPAVSAKLNADITAGDTVAAVTDVISMSVGQAKFNAKKVDGLGSTAMWAWNKVSTAQEGLLVAAKPGVVVAMALIANASVKEADAQPAMQTIVSRTLDGLPANFTVAGLQVTGSGPALDPCSLASASDIDPLMATQSEDGVVQLGTCIFQDVATHKLSVRVYALPGGETAQGRLTSAEAIILAGNAKAQAQYLTDITAGDYVAAVSDLGSTPHSSATLTLTKMDGVGDAAVFYSQTSGASRFVFAFAAKPKVLIGLEALVAPGDTSKTQAAITALFTRILASLPDSFTVQGVP